MEVLIIGASGGAAEISAMLSSVSENVFGHFAIGFLDDQKSLRNSKVYGLSVLGQVNDFKNWGHVGLISGIGNDTNIASKAKILSRLRDNGANFINCISSSAHIMSQVYMSDGVIVSPQCYIGSAVVLESFVHVMPSSTISHHSSVGFATIICSGVSIGGNTSIGSSCYIGIGVTISDHLTISNNVIVGSGSNVVSDLTIPGVYYGNPARWIRDV